MSVDPTAPSEWIDFTDRFDGERWDQRVQSGEANAGLRVTLTSHVPEIYDALTGTQGELDAHVAWLKGGLDRGRHILLVHRITRENLRECPDFIRFVDDQLRDVGGILFETNLASEDSARVRPWWMASETALQEREMGWEGPPAEWWPRRATGTLHGPAVPEEFPAAPEDCVVMGHDASEASRRSSLHTLLRKLGGFERFIHPARLDLPADLLARYCRDEPREDERVHRQVRPNPWVLFNLGTLSTEHSAPSLNFLELLFDEARDVGTTPFVALRLATSQAVDDAYLAGIRELVGDGRLLELDADPPTCPPADATRLGFDFVVQVGRCSKASDFRGATLGMWGLLSEDRQRALEMEVARTIPGVAKEKRSRPLSAWHGRLLARVSAGKDGPIGSARTRDGAWIDREACARCDFWIHELEAPRMLVGATDPVVLDRLLVDSLGLGPGHLPILAAGIASNYLYVHHQGVRVSGDAPSDRVLGRAKPLVHRRPGRPFTILGLASTTLQNHSATLLRDGEVVAAVQEERLRRQKQIGWHPRLKPNATVVSDGSIPLDRAYPWRAIQQVLAEADMAFDDVDLVALNGIPSRFFDTYSLTDPSRPPVTICQGKNVFVPHHLAHAASAFRASGLENSFIFTVDGRGERETAAFFETHDGAIHRVFDVLCNKDSLIGGVYEFITTILGFGHHGQGSTMGLAPMGKASFDFDAFLSAVNRDDYTIHDRGIMEAFGHLIRDRRGPLLAQHHDLAASVQAALENTVLRFIEDGLQGRACDNLCLAGGVALNCSLNQRIRSHFGVKNMFIQPAAHDAGTSLGAALEAHWLVTGESTPLNMRHAYLGPSYDEGRILRALSDHGLPFSREDTIERRAAELIAEGNIVCRFQGRSEFGPRALGARSILADPRSQTIKARLNTLKRRQWWRPFGPSILAGHEADYFLSPHPSPFMLFTFTLRPDRRHEVPAVQHVDGTTRPQSVSPDMSPSYHRLIEHFHRLTGVPMVVNTSFNTAFEPIVETPEDAISTFLQIGADYLAIEDFLVSRSAVEGTL